MPNYTDQLGRMLTFDKVPQRIISLVPSITELLADLDLDQSVIGVTKFCEYPKEWRRSKVIIGGTKNLRMEKIRELQPDLIISNKEENTQSEVESLMDDFPVWTSDIKNYADAISMIQSLGQLLDKAKKATALIHTINEAKDQLLELLARTSIKKVAYIIWQNPIMVAGGDTFIHAMLELSGCENVFKQQNRYPICTEEELRHAGADYILLSSEPFPFKSKDCAAFENICPTAVVQLIDGTYFSWYGSRLLPAMQYFHKFRIQSP